MIVRLSLANRDVEVTFAHLNEELEKVSSISDGLGMPVDLKVRRLVAVLRCLGFTTTGSCQGHMTRTTGGPYVMVGSQSGERLQKQWTTLPPNSRAHKQMRRAILRANLEERARIEGLLATYYSCRDVPYEQMIIIQNYGPGGSRLKCLGVEVRETLTAADRRAALTRYQQEFWDFTAFLEKLLV